MLLFSRENGIGFRIAELKNSLDFLNMAHANSGAVQSVVRALALLQALAESPADCSLSDLTKRSKLPPSTTHRLLNSLLQAGYVSQNPETARYGLGNNLILLSRKAAQKHQLIQVARPYLEQLANEMGETANLTARDDDAVIQLDHVDSPNILRVAYPVGERFPLHASASGKLFLAYLPQDVRDRILKNKRQSFTEATLVERAKLLEELKAIANRGYSIDDNEREIGVRCVAAPIRNPRGQVVAAISLTGPSLRVTTERLHELAAVLIKTGRTIGEVWNDPTGNPLSMAH
jgi:IclR family acetate operon transcriptional repressor